MKYVIRLLLYVALYFLLLTGVGLAVGLTLQTVN